MPTPPASSEAAQLERIWQHVTPPAARRMLIAAVQAFAERGFHATTTRDIAAQAGMSPAAVYIHYRSKQDLLFQISRIGHQRSLAVLAEATADATDPVDVVRRAVRAFARWHAEFHTTARVVQYELAALGPDHYAEIVALRRRSEEILRGVLEDGVDAAEFAVPDVRGTALAVVSLCIDVARWFSPGGRKTPDEIGQLYADLVLRMVGARGPGTH